MLMNTCVISIPLLVSLFLFAPNNKWGHLLGLGYFLIHYVSFLHSYILALHYSSHRTLKSGMKKWRASSAPAASSAESCERSFQCVLDSCSLHFTVDTGRGSTLFPQVRPHLFAYRY